MRIGEEAEKQVQKHFEKQGYAVLNQNDKGFPDLIAFKDRKIAFFVQVKAIQDPHPYPYYYENQSAKEIKEKLGVEVKYINVKNDGKLEEYHE
jgi:Holliday junction resolvase-like predicted endonuclease